MFCNPDAVLMVAVVTAAKPFRWTMDIWKLPSGCWPPTDACMLVQFRVVPKYRAKVFHRDAPEGEELLVLGKYTDSKGRKVVGIPQSLIDDFESVHSNYVDLPVSALLEKEEKETLSNGEVYRDKLIKNTHVATKYGGVDKHIPLRLGSGFSFFDGTDTIFGK
eukprot:3146238-Rhodomonas_salina.1